MTKRRLLTRIVAPLALVGAAGFASASMALAYTSPGSTAKETGGCTTTNPGGTSQFTFQFVDKNGVGENGIGVKFTVSGPTGSSVNPTTGTTAGGGNVSTTLTAGTGTGSVTVTATNTGTGASVSASGTCQVVALPNTGNGGSNGLPNTSTGAPGTNPMAYIGLALAFLILLAGAVTLRQTRKAA